MKGVTIENDDKKGAVRHFFLKDSFSAGIVSMHQPLQAIAPLVPVLHLPGYLELGEEWRRY